MNHSFQEILTFFGQQLKSVPPREALIKGRVELNVDNVRISMRRGRIEGTLVIEIDLGFFLIKPKKEQLESLAKANFLGVDTGGCTLSFDSTGVTLMLRAVSSPGSSLQDNWEWLHRSLNVYHHWSSELSQWKEFTPLAPPADDRSYHPRKDLLA